MGDWVSAVRDEEHRVMVEVERLKTQNLAFTRFSYRDGSGNNPLISSNFATRLIKTVSCAGFPTN